MGAGLLAIHCHKWCRHSGWVSHWKVVAVTLRKNQLVNWKWLPFGWDTVCFNDVNCLGESFKCNWLFRFIWPLGRVPFLNRNFISLFDGFSARVRCNLPHFYIQSLNGNKLTWSIHCSMGNRYMIKSNAMKFNREYCLATIASRQPLQYAPFQCCYGNCFTF